MSTQDTRGGQSQEKVGLRRKLTGPPRLLLGKSKTMDQSGERSDARALRNQKRVDSNGTPKTSVQNDHDIIGEESGPPVVIHGNLQTTSEKEVLPRSEVKGQHFDGKNKMKINKTKEGFRRFFSPAFICVRRRKEVDSSLAEGEEQRTRVTPHNTQSGDNGNHETQSNVGDTITLSARCDMDSFTTDAARKERRRFWIRTWPTFKRFLITSNSHHRSKKEPLGQDVHLVSEDIPPPKITIRKKVHGFLTRRNRAPSPVKQFECRSTQATEYEESEEQPENQKEVHEEITRIQEDCLEGDIEVIGDSAETVMVSAEVSAEVITGISHESGIQTSDPDSDVAENISESMRKGGKDQDSSKGQEPTAEISDPDGLMGTEAGMTYVYEFSLDSQVSRTSTDGAMDTNDVFFNDLDQVRSFETVIVPEDGTSSEESFSLCRITEEDVPQDEISSATMLIDGHCSEVNSNREAESETTDHSVLPVEDQNALCGESLLVQTACSLVQSAIKGALDQLSMDLQAAPTNSHRDEQGFWDHA